MSGARQKDEDWDPEENGGFAIHGKLLSFLNDMNSETSCYQVVYYLSELLNIPATGVIDGRHAADVETRKGKILIAVLDNDEDAP